MIDPIIAITGIILALIATVCFNLAMVFQKKGLNLAPDININDGVKGIIRSFRRLFKNKWWLLGAFLGIIGWPFYVISIGMVGILVTEPVMAVGFIVFVIAAIRILHEKISLLEYIAIGMLTITPILLVFAGITDVRFDMYEFVIPFIIFLSIALSISFICFILIKKSRDSSAEPFYMMFTGGILFALGGVFTNILAQAIIYAEIKFTWYFLFEIAFAIFWFDYYHLWVFIGLWGMVIMNLSSMAFYQGAIQKGKAVVMYPILDSIALVIPILSGLLVFRQTFKNFYLFTISVVFVVIAALILSRFQAEIEMIGRTRSESEL